jgi:hypothetical protein
MGAYIKKKTERSQINNLTMHLKLLKNKNNPIPKAINGNKKKIRAKINKMEIKRKHKKKINETKRWFFAMINKI